MRLEMPEREIESTGKAYARCRRVFFKLGEDLE
jgi:hypothetical protein